MKYEIERKFLVNDDSYKEQGKYKVYRQGYLSTKSERTVRVRTAGERGYITIKGKQHNNTRKEFEYEIPFEDAEHMIETMCKNYIIEKKRYFVSRGQHIWEVDEFEGVNEGLVVAEIELNSVDEQFEIPDWVGKEVSDDFKYSNSNLSTNPYSKWIKKVKE